MTGRTARAAGALRAAVVAVAALACAVPAALPASAAAGPRPAAVHGHALAADPTDVDVRLTGVSPGTLTPDAVLSVTGEVRNLGSTTLGRVTVRVHIRPERMQTRAAIDAWASGGEGVPDGPTVVTTTLPGRLTPGARVSFTARKPVDASFGLPEGSASFGPRAMTVEVVAGDVTAGTPPAADAGLRVRPVGVRRTFTVWSPDRTPPTLRLGVLVPLVGTRPTPDVATPTADTLADLLPTGRIGRLTGVASTTPGLTWAVDPALLLAAARAGSQASGGSGGTPSASPSATPTTASPSPSASGGTTEDLSPYVAAAQDWLSTIRTATERQDVWALPFADTDLVSAAHANRPGLVADARAAGADAVRTAFDGQVALPSTLGWPAGGLADRTTVDAAARAGITDLVLAGASFPSSGAGEGTTATTPVPRTTLLTGRGRTPIGGIVVDDGLSASLTQAGAGADALAQQRLVADLAAVARESYGGTARSVVVAAPRDWQVDATNLAQVLATLRGTPWLAVTPLDALRKDAAVRGGDRVPVYPAATRASELAAARVGLVATTRERLTTFAPVLVEPGPVVTPLQEESLSLLGVPWRSVPDRFEARTANLAASVDALYAGISAPSGSVVNQLAKTVSLPVTVRNSLDVKVQVVVALRPRSGRLVVEKAVPTTVEPKGIARVQVPVRAIADGQVDVEVTLLTPRLVRITQAPPISVQVHSDWENRGVAAVATLLVVLLVVGLVRGVRRGRRPSVPLDSVPDPDDVGRVLVDDAGRVIGEAKDVTPVGGIPLLPGAVRTVDRTPADGIGLDRTPADGVPPAAPAPPAAPPTPADGVPARHASRRGEVPR